MASVRFNLKRKQSVKPTAIVAIARWNGLMRKYYTGESIEPQNWNNKKQEVKQSADLGINDVLQSIKKRILIHVRTKEEFPIKVTEKKSRQQPTEKTEEPKGKNLIEAIKEYQKVLENAGRAPKSIDSYGTLITQLKGFDKKKTSVTSVDAKYLSDFQGYMMKKNYANSHIAKMVRILKTVLYYEKHIIEMGKQKIIPNKYPEQIFLTEDEIEKIANVDLRETPRLEKARDIWLMAYHTGQRYCDLSQIQIDSKSENVKVTQEKGEQQVTIPVSDGLRKIFKKYPDGLKIPTNQEVNRTIKHAAKKAGLTEIVKITHYRGGKSVIEENPKYELISCHTARRSFATNALLSGMSENVVMKFTGHKTTSEFSKYIRATANQIAEKYKQHEFFR